MATSITPGTDLVDLTGKTAIVTGGAKGIGLGIVARLHEAGAHVAIADLDAAAATEAADAMNSLRAGSARAVTTDVASPESVGAMLKATIEHLGEPDILVNNAGIFPVAPFLEIDHATFASVFDVNVVGTFLVSQAVARRMVERGAGGRIINLTSINALRASMVGFSQYDASKAAVWGFTRNIALELAPHRIWVNAIAPGAIATPGVGERLSDETLQEFGSKIPMGRIGVADDIARVALFLASDLAAYVTGSHYVVDGGSLLN